MSPIPLLLARLRAQGIEVWPEGEILRIRADRGAFSEELRAEVAAHKAEILRWLARAPGAVPHARSAELARTPHREVEPVSSAQRRLWFLETLAPHSAVNNLSAVFHLEGPLDRGALERTFDELVARHETLRCTVAERDGRPELHVAASRVFELPFRDYRDLPRDEREPAFVAHMRAVTARPLAMDAPMFHAVVGILEDDLHVLLINAHHLVWDGWSFDVFVNELRTLYAAFSRGEPSPLRPLPCRYGDFVRWHEAYLASPAVDESLAYWKQTLAGPLPLLELPCDRPRPAIRSNAGSCIRTTFDPALFDALRGVARAHQVTLNMLLVAAFDVFLQRWSGQTDVVIGTPVDGRIRPEVEGMLGLFVGTVVLRTEVDPAMSFAALLARVRETCLDAFANQDVPFERIVRAVAPARDKSRTPIYQHMFSYQEVSNRRTEMGDLMVRQRMGLHNGGSAADITFWVRDHRSWVAGAFEYSAALYDPATAERMLASIVTLLESIARDPTTAVGALRILPDAERARIVEAARRAEPDGAAPATLHEAFEASVDRSPDARALVFEEREATFAELDRWSNRVAAELLARGVRPEIRVGICIPRSIEMVVAILGALKAGGAYVPLDPSQPLERLHAIVGDASPRVVLCAASTRSWFDSVAPTWCVPTEDDALPSPRTGVRVDPSSLAYVMYTSGSTGKPKGVMVEQRQVVSFLHAMDTCVPLSGASPWIAGTSIAFDISVLELFGPLLHGRTVVLLGEKRLGLVPDERWGTARVLARNPGATLQCTPSQAAILLADPECASALGQLGELLVGGESLAPDLAERVLAAVPGPVCNMYGPTETTIWATAHRLVRTAHSEGTPPSVPLGAALSNTEVYVLDAHLEPVPRGVIGEIGIAGGGVARGYLGLPETSAERFVPHPFSDAPGTRLYRTGDLGRLRSDGTLEFLGRNDHQVKVRGFRIELGEIEACLRTHPSVRDAVVTVREDVPGDKRLVAYLTGAGGAVDDGALRAYIAARLPAPMVPAAFVELHAIPLGPSGKVDRRALPAPTGYVVSVTTARVAPRSRTESRLLGLWMRAIGTTELGVMDDFFEHGGHSLLAVGLFNDVHREFGVRLPIATLFEAPSVAALAARIDRARAGDANDAPPAWTTLVPIQPHGTLPPFFCVAGAGGNPMNLRFVAQHLGDDQPFYGVQHRGVDGTLPPHRTVEAMANEIYADIKARFPDGPYYLGGFSAGGTVAFELARTMRARGDTVGALVMFDSFAPIERHAPLDQRVRAHLQRFGDEGLAYVARRLRSRVASFVDVTRLRLLDTFAAGNFGSRNELVMAAWLEASARYRPEPYDRDIVVLQAQDRSSAGVHVGYDPHNGWRELTLAEVEVIGVEGEHAAIVHAQHAEGTARALAALLARERMRLAAGRIEVGPGPVLGASEAAA